MSEKLKILVVDDNEDFCQNVKDVLELKGYQVQTASDGFKALDIVKQNGINLVLMDIKMPVLNGVESFKKIKEVAPDLPVIMVTAYAVEELIRESLQNDAFGVLRKPVDFEKLFSMIERAILKGSMILVVDDDENLGENIKDVLNDKGFKVRIAVDGNVAIKLAEENKFDIMLIDMKLPPLNGLETYLAIKEIRPNVVVIIITGYIGEMADMIEEALSKSAYMCIEKPIDLDKLISLLKKIKRQKEKGELKKPNKK